MGFTTASIQAVLARPGILQDLSATSDTPTKSLAGWMALIPKLVWIADDQVRAFAGDGPLITDDHPLPEYLLLRATFGPPSPRTSRSQLLRRTPR